MHGLNTLMHQPAKVAAMEGLWETRRGAPLNLFGWPDQEEETTKYAVEIPKAVEPDSHPRPEWRGQGFEGVAQRRTPAGALGFLVLPHHGGDWHVDDPDRLDGAGSLFQEAIV